MSSLGGDDERAILDDEGRLFGLVNIVDLLVVLLVIAVVVAGAALLLSDSGEADTRHVTMNLGPQPDFIAEEVSPGDTFEPQGTNQSVTITDVYRYDNEEGTSVIVRATVRGTTIEPGDPEDEPTFQFQGSELRVGQSLALQTANYSVEGQLTQIQQSGESLPAQQTEFTMQTTVPAGIADEVAVGDQYRVAGESIAEITALQQFPSTNNGDRILLLGVSAETLDRNGLEFSGQPLRLGNTVPFQGDGYELNGTVQRRGTSAVETQQRQFLIETAVPVNIADDVDAGDTYQLNGQDLVRVESATFYTTDNPDQRSAVLGVSAITREEDGAILFGNRELRVGGSLPVQTSEYDISGEILRRDTLEQAGEPETVSATLELRNVRPSLAEAIELGDTERVGDTTTVEITGKSTEPADVILESETGDIFLREHPRNLDVELDATLQVRQLADGSLQFRGEPLRTGDGIPIELGQLRITVEVTALDQ